MCLSMYGSQSACPLLASWHNFAAAHAAFKFWRDVELRALAAGEIVVRLLQVFIDIQDTRIIQKVIGFRFLRFICMGGIIQGVVTIGALQLSFGMNVPGAVESFLIAQVHARL